MDRGKVDEPDDNEVISQGDPREPEDLCAPADELLLTHEELETLLHQMGLVGTEQVQPLPQRQCDWCGVTLYDCSKAKRWQWPAWTEDPDPKARFHPHRCPIRKRERAHAEAIRRDHTLGRYAAKVKGNGEPTVTLCAEIVLAAIREGRTGEFAIWAFANWLRGSYPLVIVNELPWSSASTKSRRLRQGAGVWWNPPTKGNRLPIRSAARVAMALGVKHVRHWFTFPVRLLLLKGARLKAELAAAAAAIMHEGRPISNAARHARISKRPSGGERTIQRWARRIRQRRLAAYTPLRRLSNDLEVMLARLEAKNARPEDGYLCIKKFEDGLWLCRQLPNILIARREVKRVKAFAKCRRVNRELHRGIHTGRGGASLGHTGTVVTAITATTARTEKKAPAPHSEHGVRTLGQVHLHTSHVTRRITNATYTNHLLSPSVLKRGCQFCKGEQGAELILWSRNGCRSRRCTNWAPSAGRTGPPRRNRVKVRARRSVSAPLPVRVCRSSRCWQNVTNRCVRALVKDTYSNRRSSSMSSP